MTKTEDKKRRGTLFIISAPSGAGKSTLCRKLLKKLPGIKLSVSYTTRKPRKGEINNVHYSFISAQKFKNMISKGEFAEWAMVHGNLYGTSLNRLNKLSREGYDVLLDIDVQGAKQLRATCSNAVYIFILPPSMKILKQRLVNRKTDSAETIALRLKRTKEEVAAYKDYDYVIINDKIDKALKELESIVIAARSASENVDQKLVKSFLK